MHRQNSPNGRAPQLGCLQSDYCTHLPLRHLRNAFPPAAFGRLALLLSASACDPGSELPPKPQPTTPIATTTTVPTSAAIHLDQTFQRITGFGASSAWTAPSLDDAVADLFFTAEQGIGLSLLRIRVSPDGTTDELATAQSAAARGARVWASPWTPPGDWKTNGSDTNGGSLLPEYYDAWAERLASFAKSMEEQGLPLMLLSAQNEPNWSAEWETCEWSAEELVTFVRDHLGPALVREAPGTKLVAPETIDWNSISSYGDALTQDPLARSFLGAVATHAYGGSAFAYTTPSDHGLEFWETEHTDDGSVDVGMDSGIRVAQTIHGHLTVANVNAWHYWWLLPRSLTSNSALYINGQMTRRGYVIGNWSKFVRPGFVRVAITSRPQPSVLASAFRDPNGSRFAIVAINTNTNPVTQAFVFEQGGAMTEVVPWVTSVTRALEPLTAITVQDQAFTVELEPYSVTTFVGDLSGS